jgi:3',5'-cyclic AMP phosphodiesterase CpdA
MTQPAKTGFQRVDALEIRLSGITRVVMLGDPGCTSFSDDSKKVLDQILRQEADLFFVLGDLAFTDSIEELHEMIDFCNARVKVPIFATRGNHELSSYPKLLGFSSYALVLDHHVCLFLCNATGHFLESDLDFLKNSLKTYQDKKFIVLMHIPPPSNVFRESLKSEDWEKLRAVLDPHREKVQHLFCAHMHGFHEYEINGYPVTITAGGGAAMIHELFPPAQKLHHSIAVSLHPNGSLSKEVIPVRAGVV